MRQSELREAKTFNRYGGFRTTISVGVSDGSVILQIDDDEHRIEHGMDYSTAHFVADAIYRACEEVECNEVINNPETDEEEIPDDVDEPGEDKPCCPFMKGHCHD